MDVAIPLREAAAAVSRLCAKDPAAARRISLAAGRLRAAAQGVEGEAIAARLRTRTARTSRQLDQTAAQDAMAQMDQGFDALDSILNAIGPVRAQLDDVRTLVRNLIASSLETDAQVKAAVVGTKAHATNVIVALRPRRIVIRPAVFKR